MPNVTDLHGPMRLDPILHSRGKIRASTTFSIVSKVETSENVWIDQCCRDGWESYASPRNQELEILTFTPVWGRLSRSPLELHLQEQTKSKLSIANMINKADYSLYLVTDSTEAILGSRDLIEVVEQALQGGRLHFPFLHNTLRSRDH
jgi:hypothetical protein